MKKLLILLLLAGLQEEAQAQFTSGNSFFIGTTVSIDGLTLKPTFNNLVLSNKTLTVSSQAIPGSPNNSIERVYTFNEPINVIGTVGIAYKPSELNGNAEGELSIAYYNDQEHYVTTLGSVADEAAHYVFKDFNLINSKNMLKITAVSNSVLPVTLVAFDAKKAERHAVLSWNTSTEINSNFFEIQHSRDGKEWTFIGRVLANGESSTLKNYTFKDMFPAPGENLYRLRMVDKDDTFAFSKIISLHFAALPTISVYPNPVADHVNIEMEDWTKVTGIAFYNASGELALPESIPSKNPSFRIYNLKTLQSGIYFVKTTYTDGAAKTLKIIKE
ncbi:MAG: T9SS type A sorting domain-containing protein [Dyadobacter sp.]|uniref:T9SS type A sorting domain-containing protein n=1 Tax=Dyadobacter sp. TaxID=1914288 RepID=UPI003266BC89